MDRRSFAAPVFAAVLVALVTVLSATSRQAVPPLALEPDGTILASKYGVVPGVDCTAAFRALVTARAADPKFWSATVVLPYGGIRVSGTIEGRTGTKSPGLFLRGAGREATTITGTVDGPILAWNAEGKDASGSLRVEHLSIENFHATGTGIHAERIENSRIADGRIKACNAIIVGAKQPTNVEVVIERMFLNGDIKRWPAGKGAALLMHGTFRDSVVTQWGDAALTLGRQVTVSHIRAEVNGCSYRIGVPAGPIPLPGGSPFNGSVVDCSSEASEFPVEVHKAAFGTIFQGLKVHATGNPSTGRGPTVAVDLKPGSGPVQIDTLIMSGKLRLAGNGPVVINYASPTEWEVSMPREKITANQTNMPAPP